VEAGIAKARIWSKGKMLAAASTLRRVEAG
jgi:hypothetical protein